MTSEQVVPNQIAEKAPEQSSQFTEPPDNASNLISLFKRIRKYSEIICAELSDEDIQAQSMPDASPLKWHLAHTSWAFETFFLKPYLKDYKIFDKTFEYLFNSYYNAIGAQYPRPQRGLLTRPSRMEVMTYRQYVDQSVLKLLSQLDLSEGSRREIKSNFLLLLNHEQQHQELMFTDLKHLFYFNPLSPDLPRLGNEVESFPTTSVERTSICFDEGTYLIGHRNEDFYFDNEGPAHRVFLESFALDSTLVTNKEYIEFIEDGGYQRAEFWLSEAWYQLKENDTRAPLYWLNEPESQSRNSGKAGNWSQHSLAGKIDVNPDEPVKHVNYFEASAFASWRGKRLATEQEWEVAARSNHPELNQMFNHLWQWTSSAYNAYPGFKPASGAIGEYNGKFMVNQYVLRGGSVATPDGHIRPSYRNFFYPGASWQFSGIRLAETI